MKTIPVLQLDEIQEDLPMPSLNHSFVCQKLGVLLYRFHQQATVFQQLNLNLDGWASIPDLSIYPAGVLQPDWMTDQNEVTIPPAIIVEVLSPMQILQPLLDKVRNYLKHGVKSCWVIIPGVRSASVYPEIGPSRTISEGTLRDENLGIELRVEDIFI